MPLRDDDVHHWFHPCEDRPLIMPLRDDDVHHWFHPCEDRPLIMPLRDDDSLFWFHQRGDRPHAILPRSDDSLFWFHQRGDHPLIMPTDGDDVHVSCLLETMILVHTSQRWWTSFHASERRWSPHWFHLMETIRFSYFPEVMIHVVRQCALFSWPGLCCKPIGRKKILNSLPLFRRLFRFIFEFVNLSDLL